MKPRCSLFLATTLDGYISRPDGRIDWLDEANLCIPPGEDCGTADFLATVDAVVMGRGSFELLLGDGVWPYGGRPVRVMSRRPLLIPEALRATVQASAAAPKAVLEELGRLGARHVYVDGARLLAAFLAERLVDEITLTVVPVLIGQGRPLGGPLQADLKLSLVSTRAYGFGFVQQRYRIDATG